MRIEFKPQCLLQNIVLEEFMEKGTKLRRVIETPKRIIDLTYQKFDYLPTQWYVANYNVMKRGFNGKVIKTFDTNKYSADKSQTTVQNIYQNTIKEIKIHTENGVVKKESKFKNL